MGVVGTRKEKEGEMTEVAQLLHRLWMRVGVKARCGCTTPFAQAESYYNLLTP